MLASSLRACNLLPAASMTTWAWSIKGRITDALFAFATNGCYLFIAIVSIPVLQINILPFSPFLLILLSSYACASPLTPSLLIFCPLLLHSHVSFFTPTSPYVSLLFLPFSFPLLFSPSSFSLPLPSNVTFNFLLLEGRERERRERERER